MNLFYQNSVSSTNKRNSTQRRGIMDSVLKIICALTISASISVQGLEDSSNTWETRVQATLDRLQTSPCWGLSRGSECHPSISSNLNSLKVRLYTAEGQKKLRVVLPVRKHRRLTVHSHRNNSYDAVFVLDPFPDASFGHLVFIFLVDYDVNETYCNKSMNGFHLFTGEYLRFCIVSNAFLLRNADLARVLKILILVLLNKLNLFFNSYL